MCEIQKDYIIGQFIELECFIADKDSLITYDKAYKSRINSECNHASNLISDDTCFFIKYFQEKNLNKCFLDISFLDLSIMRRNIVFPTCFE